MTDSIVNAVNRIEKGEKSVDIEYIPMKDIEDVLKEKGYDKYDFDTNGWQLDFWYYYKNSFEQKIQLSGSWYYGDYKISKV